MLQHRSHDDEGASAVEFALIVPLLVILVFGVIQFSIAYNRSQGMQASVREGARLASVSATVGEIESRVAASLDGTTVNPADVDVDIRRYPDGVDPNDDSLGTLLTVNSAVPCDGTAAGHTVRVDAEVARNLADYAVSIPFLPSFGQTFPSSAIFRCEDTP